MAFLPCPSLVPHASYIQEREHPPAPALSSFIWQAPGEPALCANVLGLGRWGQDGRDPVRRDLTNDELAASPWLLTSHRAAPFSSGSQTECSAVRARQSSSLSVSHSSMATLPAQLGSDAIHVMARGGLCTPLLLLLLFFILTHSITPVGLTFLICEMGRAMVVLVCCDDQ